MSPDQTRSTLILRGEEKTICILGISYLFMTKDLGTPIRSNFLDNFWLYCA